jgi:hypothetical protein
MPSVNNPYLSTLTPLQLTAGQALLTNTGLRVNPVVPAAVAAYAGSPLISTFLAALAASSGILTSANLTALKNLGSQVCPALSDSIPQYFINLGTFAGVTYPPGLTGIVTSKSNQYLGSPTGGTNWDMSRAAQLLAACDAYASIANQFIISACNSNAAGNNYLCQTFTDMNNTTSGDITQVNLATEAFGQDLANLGHLLDLNNLGDLGSPLALVRRIYTLIPGNSVPVIAFNFIQYGVPDDVIVTLNDVNASVSDSAQKVMYAAMQNITGNDLAQILQIIGVKTVGINTMADLLNPVKLFPNSYQSLTVPTANGVKPIYTNASGSVNTTLVQQLPNYVLSSVV